MSYARFQQGSDVHVYRVRDAEEVLIVCSHCALRNGRPFYATSAGEMLMHLAEHRGRGHKVPDKAMARLRAEQQEQHHVG